MGSVGPAVAGTWYPAQRGALESQIDEFFARADAAADAPGAGHAPGRILGLVAPHAGFVYSGLVAARGFGELRELKVDRVILLGPSHYAGFQGAVAPSAATYRTPLGDVAIDAGAISRLASPEIAIDDGPFDPEHSLEAEIPFLQRALKPGWLLVPLLLGAGTSGAAAEQIARSLRALTGPDTLVVASSDFTHYGPRFGYVPFDEDVPAAIERLDMGAVERILAHDLNGFEEYVDRTGATICGRHAIGLLMRLLASDLPGELAAYDTSGNMTGDWVHSVSYASLVFRRSPDADAAREHV